LKEICGIIVKIKIGCKIIPQTAGREKNKEKRQKINYGFKKSHIGSYQRLKKCKR
jgi:hypothetical protein